VKPDEEKKVAFTDGLRAFLREHRDFVSSLTPGQLEAMVRAGCLVFQVDAKSGVEP
jgi:hypothetical protein